MNAMWITARIQNTIHCVIRWQGGTAPEKLHLSQRSPASVAWARWTRADKVTKVLVLFREQTEVNDQSWTQ